MSSFAKNSYPAKCSQEILSFLTGDNAVSKGHPIVKEKPRGLIEDVLSTLTESMVYLPSSNNTDTNRKLWNNYAKNWNIEEPW